MSKLEFYKFQASGNDFILLDQRPKTKDQRPNYKKLAQVYCQRKFGIGADGLLVIEPSKIADFKMRIFNPDGSEAEMCGNGARCVGLWASLNKSPSHPVTKSQVIRFETKAGIIESKIKNQKSKTKNCREVMVKMSKPSGLKQDISLKVFGKNLKANYINTGVPHAVIFVDGLNHIDVKNIGRIIRFHNKFKPLGVNVDFVEFIDRNSIKLRTYERGVENETLACGTGAVASAIISRLTTHDSRLTTNNIVKVKVKSGENLSVYFNIDNSKISDIWLEGKANLVYRGEIFA